MLLLPRLLALLALLLSGPLLLVKVPWFIPTVSALQNTIAELAIGGTPAYVKDLDNQLQRGIFALCLYAIGLGAVIGLVGIVSNLIRTRMVQLTVWFSVFLVSSGLVIFEWPTVGSDTDHAYVAVFIGLPIVIALVAVCAFTSSLKKSFCR